MATVLLSDAIEEYISSRAGLRSKSTIGGDRQTLTYFLVAVGNIQTKSLDTRHGEQFMQYLAGRNFQQSTMAGHFARMKNFIGWCKARKYLSYFDDPMATSRRPKVPTKVRLRIPADRFPVLLDAAHTPRHRIVIALGLYLFVRASEIKPLRIADVDLTTDTIRVYQPKTGKQDEMPICAELDTELRRWLTWYSNNAHVPLDKAHYLVPSTIPQKFVGVKGAPQRTLVSVDPGTLVPDKPVHYPAQLVKVVMRRAGYATKDENGKSLYEGVHTLRRSGARAWFDALAVEHYDGALRTVQAMLHHATAAQTEHYLGIDLDIKKRNDLLKGKAMFAAPKGGNVVSLDVASRA